LIENLQRQDLGPLERAAAYQHYLDSFGGTIDDLGRRISESRANVSNYLRLLKLHSEIRDLLAAGELGMGQARAVAAIADHQRQLAVARLAIRRNLSVRQVEELARSAATAPDEAVAAPIEAPKRSRHVLDVEQALSRATGMRVRLYPGRKKNSGRLVIAFGSLDEFDRIAERLGGNVHLE
jgi:ParB family chromosome partitioning protein